jgi:hypothetical protein
MSEAIAAPLYDHELIFREKCCAFAERYRVGELPLLDAVDALQLDAVGRGLDQTIGTDAIQQIMSDAFRRGR